VQSLRLSTRLTAGNHCHALNQIACTAAAIRNTKVAIAQELVLLVLGSREAAEPGSSIEEESRECIDSLCEDESQVHTSRAADASSVLLSSRPNRRSVGIGKPSIDDVGVWPKELDRRKGELRASIRTFARVRESGVLGLYADDCMLLRGDVQAGTSPDENDGEQQRIERVESREMGVIKVGVNRISVTLRVCVPRTTS